MTTEIQKLLTEFVALPKDISTIGAVELVPVIQAIASHLLTAPESAEISAIAKDVKAIDSTLEAMTSSPEVKAAEVAASDVANEVMALVEPTKVSA